MERKFHSIPPTGSDYFRHIVENGRLKEEMESLGKAGFFSGTVVFDRKAFDTQWKQEKGERRQDNLAHADNIYVRGTFYRNGVGQKRG